MLLVHISQLINVWNLHQLMDVEAVVREPLMEEDPESGTIWVICANENIGIAITIPVSKVHQIVFAPPCFITI